MQFTNERPFCFTSFPNKMIMAIIQGCIIVGLHCVLVIEMLLQL